MPGTGYPNNQKGGAGYRVPEQPEGRCRVPGTRTTRRAVPGTGRIGKSFLTIRNSGSTGNWYQVPPFWLFGYPVPLLWFFPYPVPPFWFFRYQVPGTAVLVFPVPGTRYRRSGFSSTRYPVPPFWFFQYQVPPFWLRFYAAVTSPPRTEMTSPVMNPESAFDARNTYVGASSSGWPGRPIGVCAPN